MTTARSGMKANVAGRSPGLEREVANMKARMSKIMK